MPEKNCTTRCSNNASQFWERWGNGGEPEAVAAVSFVQAILPARSQGVEAPETIPTLPSWQFHLEFRFHAVYWNPATDDVKHRKSVRG